MRFGSVVLVLLLFAGCGTRSLVPYQVTIPSVPKLEVLPTAEVCDKDGEPGLCILWWQDDWHKLDAWMCEMDRELRSACRALGGDDQRCGSPLCRPIQRFDANLP